MNNGYPPTFTTASFIEPPAVLHVDASTFCFADGHAAVHKWLDAATIAYAASMDPKKYSSRPDAAATPRDAPWVAASHATTLNN